MDEKKLQSIIDERVKDAVTEDEVDRIIAEVLDESVDLNDAVPFTDELAERIYELIKDVKIK